VNPSWGHHRYHWHRGHLCKHLGDRSGTGQHAANVFTDGDHAIDEVTLASGLKWVDPSYGDPMPPLAPFATVKGLRAERARRVRRRLTSGSGRSWNHSRPPTPSHRSPLTAHTPPATSRRSRGSSQLGRGRSSCPARGRSGQDERRARSDHERATFPFRDLRHS
jgi:hypothetical protein